MENIAFDYGVHPQRVCEAIAFVEQALIKSSEFSLPSKRKLNGNNSQIVAVIIDATECETERPKNKATAIPERKNATLSKTKS